MRANSRIEGPARQRKAHNAAKPVVTIKSPRLLGGHLTSITVADFPGDSGLNLKLRWAHRTKQLREKILLGHTPRLLVVKTEYVETSNAFLLQ